MQVFTISTDAEPPPPLGGTNNDAMDATMNKARTRENVSTYNEYMTTKSVLGSWIDYLNTEWKECRDSFKWTDTDKKLPLWNGAASGAQVAPDNIAPSLSGNESMRPWLNGATNTYEVWTGQQLRYAFQKLNTTTQYTIKLMRDIDLNGYNHNWGRVGASPNNKATAIIDGNGKTIYNLGLETSLMYDYFLDGSVIKDITFKTVKCVCSIKDGDKSSSIFLNFRGTTARNVCIEDSLFFNETTSVGQNTAPFVSRFDGATASTLDNCNVKNTDVYGVNHVGGFVAIPNNAHISNCYAIGGTVVAIGGHSGGFISCNDYRCDVTNCFANNRVLGASQIGGFEGYSGRTTYKNCFASGAVEGFETLGGFQGLASAREGYDAPYSQFINCYSTVIVGMQNGGLKQGGFVGEIKFPATFTNCYAVGEVGSLDTDVSDNRTSYLDVGGFFGVNSGTKKDIFTNCYYDKQTSAMRGWASGPDKVVPGIKGLLTNSKKGEGTQKMVHYELAGFDPNVWTFEDNLYPQLKVFADTSMSGFSNPYDKVLAKAYSGASVSTPILSSWDYDISIPDTAYDTVRDITLDFPLSKNDNYDLKWTNQGTFGAVQKDKHILELSPDSFFASVYTVGIEWIFAKNTVTEMGVTAIGIRPLRIIPTKSLIAGNNKVRYVGDSYNNWEDVTLIDSTALGLNKHILRLETITPKVGEYARLLVENGLAPVYTTNSPYIEDELNRIYDYFDTSPRVKNIFNGEKQNPIPAYYGDKKFAISYSWVLPDGRFLTDSKLLDVIGKIVHIRQVVVDYNYKNEVELPVMGYMRLNNVKLTDTSLINFTSNINTNSGRIQDNPPFSDFKLSVDPTADPTAYEGYTIDFIVPQHYKYEGHTITSINSPHETEPGSTSGFIFLDYSNLDEYWITIYIKQIDYNIDNNIDYYTNDFGIIE